MRHFSFEHQYVTPLVTRNAPHRLQLNRTRQVVISEPAGPGDGGLGVMFMSFCIATSLVLLAAPDLFRWAATV